MIASFIPGRVRLRSRALKNPETMRAVLDMAEGFEGVVSAAPNRKTGSVLIIYDPEVIDEEMLAIAAAAFEDQFGAEEREEAAGAAGFPNCLKGRRGELNLLLGALGLTVAGLTLGKGAHAALGGFFCLLSAKHVYDRRKRIF